ncbi:hypothetical protein N7532_009236 [Penicillium argentinense]|uniref:Uncharacterized protein n=1 Tax=Penicillium argentinense TaxID=1131581 RepID=A0A9W9EYY5_9EURO|nr:uncharacterized protein N7532_009236 [Penicillium argentinense]KAJ5090552.1 hypothetical protein N7532_009236 [Penicillium argentinense]
MSTNKLGESPPGPNVEPEIVKEFARMRETSIDELEDMYRRLSEVNEQSRTIVFQSIIDRLPKLADEIDEYLDSIRFNRSVGTSGPYCLITRYNRLCSSVERAGKLLQFIPRPAHEDMPDDYDEDKWTQNRTPEQLSLVTEELNRNPYIFKQLQRSVDVLAVQIGRLTLSNNDEMYDEYAFFKDSKAMKEDKSRRKYGLNLSADGANMCFEVNELWARLNRAVSDCPCRQCYARREPRSPIR